MNRDWRHFFEETELDNAFQRVEVEQREISEEGTSAGSTSNPSDDNLDQEAFADVYNIQNENEKLKQLQRLKEEEEEKLRQQVTQQNEFLSGQQMFNKLAGKPDQEKNNGKDQNAGRNI